MPSPSHSHSSSTSSSSSHASHAGHHASHPSSPTFTTATTAALTWPLALLKTNPIPHRYRRRLYSKLHARQSPASSLTGLQTSYNPADSIRALRKHRWGVYDAQYIVLALLAVFSLSISDKPSPLIKTAAAAALSLVLLVPVSRQFVLPFLPIATWLLFFFSARFIPSQYRPHIWVRVLPALENILYGANLSNILSAHPSTPFDLLAWLPYGILHFAAPFLCSIAIFLFAPPTSLPAFARTFGYLNITGVVIQVLFPCSPPWYENMYGLAPANYSMQGSPAGLARIDKLFGLDMYTSSFTATNPMVFGAFPSLHAANAVLEALFLSNLFPRLRPVFIGYVLWLWWATMYLSHHYAVDLVGGSCLAGIAFFISRTNFLPRVQADKASRWDYDYVEIGESGEAGVGMNGYGGYDGLGDGFGLQAWRRQSDEWTMGSSSGIESGGESPRGSAEGGWETETLADRDEMVEVVVR